MSGLSCQLTPAPPIPLQRFADRWRDLIAAELVDGDTLLHTDMMPRNFLLADRLRLVHWSSPAHGAAWIDTAFLLVRLIRAGHEPAAAEACARQVPAWAHASGEAVNAFADGLGAPLGTQAADRARSPPADRCWTQCPRWRTYRSAISRR
ncbi:hypothetical protein ACN26Y_02425 [Micromonospora sp. WMMD558]|uniref:hypothetical protein n=1 Tax=unclassified Micromonospora TaxID=2617518 RepID=UPI0012B474BA|nr:hypothetical protein [Micromonospora sp. WMMC415]QGN50487.1 hypothetical protein GKC29_29125 [Micromonospora sp. WMMC415]